jgi:hypothetical protein
MKLSMDSRLTRKVAEAIIEKDRSLSIRSAINQAITTIDMVRYAEIGVHDDYVESQYK